MEFAQASNGTYAGVISGTGALTKSGIGTVTLTGANTYTGATTVNAGGLTLSGGSSIADSSAVTVASGATMTLGVGNETIGSLAGAGNVILSYRLTLGGDNTSTTFSGVISSTNTSGLTKTGSGTLTLSGANTYTGSTTVSAGGLTTGGAAVIADSSAVTVASGATLTLGGNETIGGLSGAGTVALGANTLTAGGDSTSTTFSGVMSGTGGLTKTGSGTMTLSGANTYTGATTILAGTLTLNNSSGTALADNSAVAVAGTLSLASATETIGALSGAGTVAIGANALTISQSTDTAFSGGFTSTITGSLIKDGTGKLTLSGNNSSSFAGNLAVSGGTLEAATSANLNTGAISLGANTVLKFTDSGSAITAANAVTLAGNAALNSGNNTVTLSGQVSGAFDFLKQGSGTLILTGTTNSYGATSILAGTVSIGSDSNLGANAVVLNGSTAVLDLTNSPTIDNSFVLGPSGGTVNVAIGTGTLTGVISESVGAAALVKSGAGTLVLTGANTNTGAITVSAGTLVAASNTALGTTAGGTTVTSGAALALQGGITVAEAITGLAGTGVSSDGALLNISGTNTLSGNVTLTANAGIGVTAGALTLSGVIGDGAGSFGVTKLGSGTLTLSGANTYDGATTVSAGTLSVAADSNLGTGTVTLALDTTLQVTGATTIDNAIVLSGSATIQTDAAVTVSGVLSGGAQALTKTGSGTLTLSNTATYTGGTTIKDGVLATDDLPDTGTLTFDGGTLSARTATGFNESIAVTVTANGGGLDVATGNISLSGIIAGSSSGALTVAGGGGHVLYLSGNNTFDGGITLNTNGYVDVGSATALGSGTLTINGSNSKVRSTVGSYTLVNHIVLNSSFILSGSYAETFSGTVDLNNGSRTINDSISGNLTFNGAISNGSLIIASQGTGLVVLGGSNSSGYTTTTVSSGTLSITDDSNLGSGGVTLNGGVLTVTGTGTIDNPIALGSSDGTVSNANAVTLSGVISGASGADLTKTGAGTLTLSATNTYAGATTVSAGVLSVALDSNLGTGTVTLASGTTLQVTGATTIDNVITLSGDASVNNSAAVTLSGAFSESGGARTLTKTGVGTLTLTNTGNEAGLTGGVTVAAGTLSIADDNALAGGTVTLAAGAVLSVTGATTIDNAIALSGAATIQTDAAVTVSGALSGGAQALTKTGSGTLTLSSTSNEAGLTSGVTVSGGTLAVAVDDALVGGTVTLDGGTLSLAQITINQTFDNAITVGSSDGTVAFSAGNATLSGQITAASGRNLTIATSVNSYVLSLSNAGNSATFAGNLTVDSGTVDVKTAGNLNTGSITLNAGTKLQFTGTNPTTFNLANTLTLTGNATISTNSGNSVTFSGQVSGNYALTKSAGGTLTLSGTNSYGATTVLGGTLSVAADSNLGSGAVTLNGGTLEATGSGITIDNAIALGNSDGTVSNANALTLSGVISGAGGADLTKSGAGTLTLSGTNTYAGATTVSAGTLSVAADSNLGTGTVTLNGGTLEATGSGITIDNAIALGSSDGTVSNANALTLSGVISGASGADLAKSGAGTLTLSGTHTYAGATTVSAGTLSVTGVLGATSGVTVSSGATLGGSGSVFATSSSNILTVNNGGTLAPGVSGAGTLTVNGNLAIDSGGTLSQDINGTTAGTGYDQIQVIGTVNITGASLSALTGFTPNVGDSFVLISNDGTDAVTGTFNGLNEGDTLVVGGSTFLISYQGGSNNNDIVLTAIDATPPVVQSITSPSNSTYKIGDALDFVVTFSEAVTISGGTPSIAVTLNTGGTVQAQLVGTVTNSTTATFRYTVADGNLDTNGIGTAATISANGSAIKDAADNAMTDFGFTAPITTGVLVDGVAPTLAITSNVSAVKTGETATITFTFSEDPGASFAWNGSTGDIVVTGGTLGAISGTGLTRTATFTPTANLASGSAGITVASGTYTDTAGNNGGAGTTPSLSIDTLAPTLAITSNVSAIKASETATITFTFSEDPGASFAWNGSTGDIVVTGGTLGAISGTGLTRTATFTPTANLASGSASITVASGTYTDTAGNSGGAGTTPSLSIDTLAPTLTIDTLADDNIINDSEDDSAVTLTGTTTAENGQTVTINFGGISTSATASNGTWTTTVSADDIKSLPEGSVIVTANVNDVAGNAATEASATVIYDRTAPNAPVITAVTDNVGTVTGPVGNGGSTDDTVLQITGTAEANSTVTLYNGTVELGEVTADASGNWSFITGTLNNGSTYVFNAKATDAVGNTGDASSQHSVTIDTRAQGEPTISGTPVQGQTLSADTSAISDPDGLGSFSYVWKADGIAISGATGSSYTLTEADVGKAISVEVRFTDGSGSAEGPLTSAATGTVSGSNNAPQAAADHSTASGLANAQAVGNVLTNDQDADPNDSLTVTAIHTGGTGAPGNIGQPLSGDYGSLVLNADGSYTYTVATGNTEVDALGFGAQLTDSFSYTVSDSAGETSTATLTVTIQGIDIGANDQDGITTDIENAANGGDFNKDGIADAAQSNVTALPLRSADEFDEGVVAPVASFGAVLVGDVAAAGSPAQLDSNAQFGSINILSQAEAASQYGSDIADELAQLPTDPVMTGLLDFTVQAAPGSVGLDDLDPSRAGIQTRVIIELPEGISSDTYYKIGKTPDNLDPHIYAYMADNDLSTYDDGAQLLDLNGDGDIERIVLTFTDGAKGDDDLEENGIIVDPGFLGNAVTLPPIVITGLPDRASYAEGHAPVRPWTDLAFDNNDGGALTSATVTLDGFRIGDRLKVDARGTGLTAHYDKITGILTLSGSADPAVYQSVLHSLKYFGREDFIVVETRSLMLTVTNTQGNQSSGQTELDISPSIIIGTPLPDKLTGTYANDVIIGRASNDRIHGRKGSDLIKAGTGNDWLEGGNGHDDLRGNRGDDTIQGGLGNDTARGGIGNDLLCGNTRGNDYYLGGQGHDTVDYSASPDGVSVNLLVNKTQQISIGSGSDRLNNIENLIGSAFNDRLSGNQEANNLTGLTGDDLLSGRGGNDHIDGGAGNDTVRAGTGNDRISGSTAGDDRYLGGRGNDTVDYSASPDGVSVSLDKVNAQLVSVGSGTDRLKNIENLIGSQFSDNLTGNRQANKLTGLDGNDSIDGGDGNDKLRGNGGNDTLIGDDGDDICRGGAGDDLFSGGMAGNDRYLGGQGNDTVDYSASPDRVTVALTTNKAQQASVGSGRDTLSSIENLIGSHYDDSLSGNRRANTLIGQDGNDSLAGRVGNDRLDGGTGNDLLRGGAGDDLFTGDTSGNDHYLGGTGIDTVDYSESADGITVNLMTTVEQPISTGSGTDILIGIENLLGSFFNDDIRGNDQANTLIGLGGADIMRGKGGNDTLDGGTGNDILKGNYGDDTLQGGEDNDIVRGGLGNDRFTGSTAGDDRYFGGAGSDTLKYSQSPDGVSVSLMINGSQTTSIGSGSDFLVSIENLVGSRFNDNLVGDANANRLGGGRGSDTLSGGAGADRFIFSTALVNKHIDTLTDFNSGEDIIELSAGIFTAYAGQVGQTVGLSSTLSYDAGTGMLAYDADGLGEEAATEIAIIGLSGHPAGLGDEFLIIA
ncbi:MAG: autotransporter-associated beta strand repeat-containing protein [Methylovulum sp.]|nr:autotransporter-associated beta strand repeat-containing protein [Methylovulum sp.]